MSIESERGRAANKAKAKRLCEASNEKVDASSWEPGQTFSADKKLGPRPVNPREYRNGGIVRILGESAKKNAGKKPRGENYTGGTRPTGGREARASGGRAKGKTNINIIIDAGKGGQDQAMPPPMMPPPHPPVPPPAMPPPQMGGGAPGAGAPPPMAMPRRSGGRTKMTAGAGSGEGRLQKIELQD